MSATNDGGPAFHSVTCRDGDNYNAPRLIYHRGMSLRDWFAGQALAGIMSSDGRPEWDQAKADWAYAMADAMLRAREGGAR